LLGLAALVFMVSTTVGCAFSELLAPPATPTPAPTRTLAPTFHADAGSAATAGRRDAPA
jgi:hypothetical protein